MGPIQVSAPGTDLRTATGADITLNTKNPFAKLDSTNKVSFQVINLLFLHEPPNPNGTSSTYQRTLVYSFPHRYKYVTSSWFLLSLDGFATARGSEGNYLVGGGAFATSSSAVLIVTVDQTNVNIYVDKYWVSASGFSAPSIIGFTASIRAYIFVNDLTGNDIPVQA
jgi:hypothetical protein